MTGYHGDVRVVLNEVDDAIKRVFKVGAPYLHKYAITRLIFRRGHYAYTHKTERKTPQFMRDENTTWTLFGAPHYTEQTYVALTLQADSSKVKLAGSFPNSHHPRTRTPRIRTVTCSPRDNEANIPVMRRLESPAGSRAPSVL